VTYRRSLIEFTDQVFVVAHKEDTSRLERALIDSRFQVKVQRGPYTNQQTGWSSAMKCFANHANVWREISHEPDSWAIVVEADFVPVRNFGSRIAPLPYAQDASVGFAWLYSAGSTLYGFCKYHFPHGHGNTTVAYMLSGRVASLLLEFFDREVSKNTDGRYVGWETYLGIFLRREKGVLNYIATYQMGEHGGVPQLEHERNGVRSWHQADALLAGLEFLPTYARGSLAGYSAYRLRAIVRGWLRLFTGRFFDPRHINHDTSRGRFYMMVYSLGRLLRLIWR
jgi:hypothetical protein